MLYKLHFFLITSGWCASTTLLGVFIETYTDASSLEIGGLFMAMPFASIVARPLICSLADREVAHKKYLILSMLMLALSYFPFILIPFLGPAVYAAHPRASWYVLATLKVLGDMAISGAISIGDALAMNYARRIGVEFMVYRVWGTASWMLFGLVIGQINEVSFLPKFTPAFMVMVGSALIDALIIWLWPDEYFRMVPFDQIESRQDEEAQTRPWYHEHMKSLMPRGAVLAEMRAKLAGLFGLSVERSTEKAEDEPPVAGPSGEQHSDAITVQDVSLQLEDEKQRGESRPMEPLSKGTQLRILWLLLRRDPRVLLYTMFFIFMGILLTPSGFFFMGVAELCQEHGYDFSQLAGLLQLMAALTESILFIYIKPIKSVLGRVKFGTLAIMFSAIEYSIYASFWHTINPYYTLITTMFRGICFGASIVLMTDVAYVFANEVEYLIPELVSKGLALTAAANDGIGRGLGAMMFGIIIDAYSYQTLWVALGVMSSLIVAILVAVNLFESMFRPNLGLDVRAKLEVEKDLKTGAARSDCKKIDIIEP